MFSCCSKLCLGFKICKRTFNNTTGIYNDRELDRLYILNEDNINFEKDAYKAAMEAREEAREKINEICKATIKKATADAKIALASATTAEQKLIVMNTLKNARTTAVAIRDAALAALGSLPTPPVEPKKVEKRRTLAP